MVVLAQKSMGSFCSWLYRVGASLVRRVVAYFAIAVGMLNLLSLGVCQHPVQSEGSSLDHQVGRRAC